VYSIFNFIKICQATKRASLLEQSTMKSTLLSNMAYFKMITVYRNDEVQLCIYNYINDKEIKCRGKINGTRTQSWKNESVSFSAERELTLKRIRIHKTASSS
jgi:hypothetical protein